MRISTALVAAVLIWSSARYLPPYFLALHKIDQEDERLTLQQLQTNAVLHEARLQARPQATTPAPAKSAPAAPIPPAGPSWERQSPYY